MNPPNQQFPHEKLQVYTKILEFAGQVAAWISAWDKKHALVDHLFRATESMVLNLAEAARLRGEPTRLRILDYAIGSSLECAGCLDVAQIKKLLTPSGCGQEKDRLCQSTKMLIGLRKAWATSVAREEPIVSRGNTLKASREPFFHHESLEVYQLALRFMEWFMRQPDAKELSNRLLRQLDEAGTSVVLNIAEGNGRYAELDHHRFLHIAQSSAVKAAVFLDLCVQKSLLAEAEVISGKQLLRRISDMVAGF